jgi:hypothetical protein
MKPLIGQIVIHRDSHFVERSAIVTSVWPDKCVNLQVFLDGISDAQLLSQGSNTLVKTDVPYHNSQERKIGDCWRFPDEQAGTGIGCDCCGAPWVSFGHVQGYPCNCHTNKYCSTCTYCEEHCQCGPDQDLQPDFQSAILARLDRLTAREELPYIYPRKTSAKPGCRT